MLSIVGINREAVDSGEWIEKHDLFDQAQVYALIALYAGIGIYEPDYDYLPYVIVLVAVTLIIAFFMLRRWRIDS